MSWLSEHCTARRAEVARKRSVIPESELRAKVLTQTPARPFLSSLRRKYRVAIISEIKFRSPSMGQLRLQQDVEQVAASYETGGASALSVLIDETHFGGKLEYLTRARNVTQFPVLAKGFLVDPYDVIEARAAGADAVLLIASCLEREELESMHALATQLGMAALVELHSEADFQKILGLNFPLVGVNHRDLHTLQMDMDLTARLAPQLPASSTRVAESGIKTPEDLTRMKSLGYHAVLVGTRFMKHEEPGTELRALLEQG
jgi:indole-3-glycerol phosphate synthase